MHGRENWFRKIYIPKYIHVTVQLKSYVTGIDVCGDLDKIAVEDNSITSAWDLAIGRSTSNTEKEKMAFFSYAVEHQRTRED
jgi:hypothetical protein